VEALKASNGSAYVAIVPLLAEHFAPAESSRHWTVYRRK
jgi:hypothetical protein